MPASRLTVAQALVRFLDNQYLVVDGQEYKFITGIWAIFGHGNILGLGQALAEQPHQLLIHQGRNEQGMAHAAIGYAKQKLRRQIYACTSSVGPGAANMVTAAATATANRIPLLLLPGDTFASRQPDPVLQQLEQPHDLTISTNDAFRSVSKYWDRVTRPEQLMSACLNAMRVLTDPAQTGAVTLCLPQDVQGESYDYPNDFFAKRQHHLLRTPAEAGQIEQALSLLASKQRPLVICGGGVKYAGAEQAFLQFVEHWQLPFAETQAGKGTLLANHPLNMGGIGTTGSLAANQLAQQADLVIGVGTRYTDFTTSSKWQFQQPDVQFININISRFDSYKLSALPIVADANMALSALVKQSTATASDIVVSRAWQQRYQACRAELDAETERVYHVACQDLAHFTPEVADGLDKQVLQEFHQLTGSLLTQSQVLGYLNRSLAADSIIVAASGSLPGDLQRIWQVRSHNSYHVEYGFSCMGYEINAALGVKLAEPQRDVYALVGDGAFMMSHSELVSAVQERQNITILLFDNMANGCINNLQLDNGMGSFYTEFRFRREQPQALDGPLIPIDFATIAKGYGCQSFKVTTLDQLAHALQQSQQQAGPTLLDIKVLPKTMLHGYHSWWHVGLASSSSNPAIIEKRQQLDQQLKKAKKY